MKRQRKPKHTTSKLSGSILLAVFELNQIRLFDLRNKFIEKELHENCVEKLGLTLLTKDDSVHPDRMIDCLKRLLDVDVHLDKCNLHITNYYSVLSDGTMCIPWDWKL